MTPSDMNDMIAQQNATSSPASTSSAAGASEAANAAAAASAAAGVANMPGRSKNAKLKVLGISILVIVFFIILGAIS